MKAARSETDRVQQLEEEVRRLRAALTRAQGEFPDARTVTLAAPGAALRPERILLVDDHPFDRKVVHMMLASLGFAADQVDNGSEALQALERQPYDIVLMDVQMPQLDGIETTRRIRERWPGIAGPRVIALTSRSMPGDREACLRAGMDDYMSKPVPLQVLAQKLENDRQPLVDARQFERCHQLLGAAALKRMVQSFSDSLPAQLGNLRRALEQGNATDLADYASSLRDTSEILGVRRVAAAAQSLQRLALAGALDYAPASLARLESLQTRLIAELTALQDGTAPRP